MKIAICFFGITRNLRKYCLDSIEEFLLKPVYAIDPEYQKFGHFNLARMINNPRSKEINVPVDVSQFELLRCDVTTQIAQEVLDAKLPIAEISRFGDAFGDNFCSLRNLIRQLYSLNEVTRLLIGSGQKFDLVIYSRPDLRFESPVQILKPRPGTLYTPWFDKYRGLSDRFAFGDFRTMVLYGQRYARMAEYCRETGEALHSEKFLKWHAETRGIRNIDLTGIRFARARANGQTASVDERWETKLKYRTKKTWRLIKGDKL